MTIEIDADALDFRKLVRAGDSVFWGHGTSEPVVLSRALMRQRADFGRFEVFLGPTFSDTVAPEHGDYVDFRSYCGIGANQALHAAGVLQVVPCHLSDLPKLIEGGNLRCDVALLQISGANETGMHSLGVSSDYMIDAASRARVVVAEVNESAPWTCGNEVPASLRFDYLVRTSRPVLEMAQRPPSSIERRIADHVAARIPDRAVLQLGIGAVPQAIASRLRGHRDLAVHSGMIDDGICDLIEAGVITNAFKSIDPGVSVTGMLAGTERLYRFAHRQTCLRLRPLRYTHAPDVLARLERLHSVNSAIEVDLSGQVNAEMIGERYVGAVGGQVDFVRAAHRSPGGRAIIALPATAAGGSRSRIVARLPSAVVTTTRSDADLFVTEWGVADLRGQPLGERMRRMVRIADPAFRDELERTARGVR